MMELKNFEPKTVNDFTIAMMIDSCEEIFEVNEIIKDDEENKL